MNSKSTLNLSNESDTIGALFDGANVASGYGNVAIGSGTLTFGGASGNATFMVRGLAIQNYVLQAYYGGDATHSAARSQTVDQFVIKGVVLPPAKASD